MVLKGNVNLIMFIDLMVPHIDICVTSYLTFVIFVSLIIRTLLWYLLSLFLQVEMGFI